MSNPFFDLQARLKDLIVASTYFAGLPAERIVTEAVGDLEFQVANVVIPMGFGVVITTAAGKADESSYEALTTDEDLNISITHNPTTDPTHSALDAVFAVVQAVQGQPKKLPAPTVTRLKDHFIVTGHQRRFDAPPGLHVHEVHVSVGLRLL